MAQYFKVVNTTKKQYFSIGAFGGPLTLYGVGRGLNGMIVSRLLTSYGEYKWRKSQKYPNELRDGYWIGDQVVIVGDYDEPGQFGIISEELPKHNIYSLADDYGDSEYEDVTDKILMWMIKIGFEDDIAEAAFHDYNFLKRVGHLAFSNNLITMKEALEKTLGEDWPQKMKGI